ncbi:FAD/NAD(P)-binding domain-containing protein [Mycena olivaceomarginata]|nr:FAD/NAD(P)-binding domain-containing protein [Mycena olivaceomarginata]
MSAAAINGAAKDGATFADLFIPTGWLRDLLCFSWDFRTMAGRGKISEFLDNKSAGSKSRIEHAALHNFQIETTSTIGPPATFPVPGNPGVQGVSAAFAFSVTSPPASGRGFFRLFPDGAGGWKAFTVLMNLAELAGHEEPTGRPLISGDIIWEEERAKKIIEIENDPTVVIIGGGQAGLMCGTRFGRMGIRALVIERTGRVGDVWRNRYPNLRLHTPAHHSSCFVPKEKLADFLKGYAVGQEIHVWLSSTVLSTPIYNDATKRWTVEIDRAGNRVTLAPKHIIMATGNGKAKIPTWPGMDSFAGPLYHSDSHTGAALFKGKRVIVVGACNAAGDICHDFVNKGAAEVTMIQCGATCVISSAAADKALFSVASSERQTIEDIDFMDQKLHDDLTKAGFKLTWELTPGDGEVGLCLSVLDMGCGQQIVEGKVKVKQEVEIEKLESDGMVFKDGSKIQADVIVLATGYEPIIANAVAVFGEGIKEKIGSKIWGLDEEGELNCCYRPTGAPGLWIAPGAIQHSRFFSKHVAIQILAQELGLKI